MGKSMKILSLKNGSVNENKSYKNGIKERGKARKKAFRAFAQKTRKAFSLVVGMLSVSAVCAPFFAGGVVKAVGEIAFCIEDTVAVVDHGFRALLVVAALAVPDALGVNLNLLV